MLGREGSMNVCKFFVLQHNVAASSEAKTTYKKYLRISKENEWGFIKKVPIKKVYWCKPSQEILDVYIPMQNEFKGLIRHNMKMKEKDSKTDKEANIKKIGRQQKAIELYEKGIPCKDIANVLQITVRRVQMYIKEYKENVQKTKKCLI